MLSCRTSTPLILLVVLGPGCVTETPEGLASESEFLTASPLMREQIDRRIDELTWLEGQELIDAVYWLSQRGETAYPALFEALEDEAPKVRCAAISVLASRRDRRVIDRISDLRDDDNERVRLEAARALVLLGDWTALDPLVDGLEHESLYVRASCHRFLKDQTRMDFGFVPGAKIGERREAVARWRAWLERIQTRESAD